MFDSDEHRPQQPGSGPAQPAEFARLTEFAQRGSVLSAAERIRVLGTRRLHRRRAGQAVLGAGALAVVVFLGTGLTQNGSGHPGNTLGSGSTPRATATVPAHPRPRPTVTPSSPVVYTFPETVVHSSTAAVQRQLQQRGFVVTVKLVPSNTIVAGNAIDIENSRNQSLLGREVPAGTTLVLVGSAGPAH